MTGYGRIALRDLLLLSLATGCADAAGFMELGHVFTSNMTGNIVLLGIALGQGQWHEAFHVFYVLLIFMTGSSLGAWMIRDIDEKDWSRLVVCVISWEAALLSVFALGWLVLPDGARTSHANYLLIPLAFSMGLQATAMNWLSVPGVATTAITGTLTSLMNGIIQMITSKTRGGRVAFHALVICFYGGGAILSGILMFYLPRFAGLPPAALALLVTLSHVQALRVRKN